MLLLASLACLDAGSRRRNTASAALTVLPATASVNPGQTVQFQLAGFAEVLGSLTWTVIPAQGGSINAAGLFTAAQAPGDYQIRATRGSASASAVATILPPPAAASPSLSMVEAAGSHQHSADGRLQLSGVLNEPYLATTTQDASGFRRVRAGFDPGASLAPPPARR